MTACTLASLETLAPFKTPVSCWLNVEAGHLFDVTHIVPKLLALGCQHLAVSGKDAERLHDIIDEIVVDDGTHSNDPLILTTWHSGPLTEIAFDVLAVNCPEQQDSPRLLLAIADTQDLALARLAEMITAIRVV